MATKNLTWSYSTIQTDVSNISAYAASVLSQAEGATFEGYTLTEDNKGTFLSQMAKSAVYSLIPFFNRTISDGEVISATDESIGFTFTPRISGGAFSEADYTLVEDLSRQHIVNYILKEWYAIKGVVAMANYFISNLASVDKQLEEMLVRFVRPTRRRSLNIRNVVLNDGETATCGCGGESSAETSSCFDYSDPVEGSELLMSFKMEPLNDVHLADCEFSVQYYTTTISKCHTIAKAEMKQKSEDEYLALVHTDLTGAGTLRYLATIEIPNEDAIGGTLKLLKDVATSVNIRPMPE